MTDGRHVSSAVDVRTFRGPNIDSDHYFVAAEFQLCLEVWALLCIALRSCDDKEQLWRYPLKSLISSFFLYLISTTLADCRPTFPLLTQYGRNCHWFRAPTRNADAGKIAAYKKTFNETLSSIGVTNLHMRARYRRASKNARSSCESTSFSLFVLAELGQYRGCVSSVASQRVTMSAQVSFLWYQSSRSDLN